MAVEGLNMNRKQMRASKSEGRRLQKLSWNSFQDVTIEAINKARALNPESTYQPDQVLQNNKFIVQIFTGREVLGMPATKAMIRRSDSGTAVFWSDLQRIKNEIFGTEAQAIQVFPRESELTDVANLYWLWVIN